MCQPVLTLTPRTTYNGSTSAANNSTKEPPLTTTSMRPVTRPNVNHALSSVLGSTVTTVSLGEAMAAFDSLPGPVRRAVAEHGWNINPIKVYEAYAKGVAVERLIVLLAQQNNQMNFRLRHAMEQDAQKAEREARGHLARLASRYSTPAQTQNAQSLTPGT